MKGLPIGKQHLGQLIEQNLIYIDKTPLIYRMVEEGRSYFLSRPRRFGKSLLVDTLKNIFLGNRNLFEGLWIYDKIEWQEHPVIHLDFSAIDYEGLGLTKAIMDELDSIARSYELTLHKESAKGKLKELITQLADRNTVALLIDEYDKPITDYITDLDKANANREILRDFYGVLKSLGDKLRILFITGITKFSRVSLFSVLNHITDITLRKEYSTICGVTQEELIQYFDDYLQQAQKKLNLPQQQLIHQINQMYDGYSWDGQHFVFNPFSLLNFLDEVEFKSYWFKTGTPRFLIELLREQQVSASNLEKLEVEDTFFDTFNIEEGIAIEPLLFQTGYWTVKKMEYDNFIPVYTLDYPNQEVKRAFLHNLMEIYTFKPETTINTVMLKLRQALRERNIEAIQQQLNILFADISYHLFPPQKNKKMTPEAEQERRQFLAWEGYFQTIIYIVFQYMGIYMHCELTKHRGRLDAVIEVNDYVYITEFKLEDAKAALQQIKDKDYHLSYQNSPKEILLMGIAFDRANRQVKPIEWEIWKR